MAESLDGCSRKPQKTAQALGLRKTANVKRLIERLSRREDWTRATETSQGGQVIEDKIKLSDWSQARRMVVMRRRIKRDIALTAKNSGSDDSGEQLVLALPHDEVQDHAQLRKYTVLVTHAPYEIAAIGQNYRDRCDCENGLDELKNPWGWGAYLIAAKACAPRRRRDWQGAEKRRGRGCAPSALRELTRGGCLSAVSASERSEFRRAATASRIAGQPVPCTGHLAEAPAPGCARLEPPAHNASTHKQTTPQRKHVNSGPDNWPGFS